MASAACLLVAADRRRLTSALSRQIAVFALALGAYFVSLAFGGNGFIAAFVAGLAFGGATQKGEERAELFSETAGILLSIGVWVVFGATLVGSLILDTQDLRPILYAVLSLTVIRMAPVAIALLGSRLTLPTVAFIGWFGPRGLASIVFGILALDALTGVRRADRPAGRDGRLDGPPVGRRPRIDCQPTRRSLRPMDRRAPASDRSAVAGARRAVRPPAERADSLGSEDVAAADRHCQMIRAGSHREAQVAGAAAPLVSRVTIRPSRAAKSHTSIDGGSMPTFVSAVQIWLRWSVPWWSAWASRIPSGAWVS